MKTKFPVYPPLVTKAIAFAMRVHELEAHKKRKGKDVPYITHPLTVGLILARVTKDENIIAAGILHDTVEDCEPYGSVTKETIEREFNGDVARMVNDVTEQDKNLPWMERKMAALAHIKDMKQDSLLVKSADVLHNLADLNGDIRTAGTGALGKFNASQADTVLRYRKLIAELKRVWAGNPLLPDLEENLRILLEFMEILPDQD